jgi:hypothetical protein
MLYASIMPVAVMATFVPDAKVIVTPPVPAFVPKAVVATLNAVTSVTANSVSTTPVLPVVIRQSFNLLI